MATANIGSNFYSFPEDSSRIVLSRSHSNQSPSSGSDIGFPNPMSLEDSPLSSPSDVEYFQPAEDLHSSSSNNIADKSANKKPVTRNRSASGSATLPIGVRLPQRKGGMHLWQFLYSILQMPEKYSHLVEWTSNQTEFEFRLLEPDAIAVWWGHHKNKKNMSYDKLSRSLRYYYDKQIIRKIGGERYVYRFCVNPEVMYKAIGNSENRPKLKPMPKSAENMLFKNQHARTNTQVHSPSCSAKSTFVAEEPDVLSHCTNNDSLSNTSMQYPVQSYPGALHIAGLPIETSNSIDNSTKACWQPQGKLTSLPYHSAEAYQELNYFYNNMFPQESAQSFPGQLSGMMNESFSSEADPRQKSPFVTQQQSHLITCDQVTSGPEASLNAYVDSRHVPSSYFSANTIFVPEANHEFASLPNTVDSIATCNEYGSMPLAFDMNNGVYTVCDNPAASWPLVAGTNADFSNWYSQSINNI